MRKTTVPEAVHLYIGRKKFIASYSVCVCVFYTRHRTLTVILDDWWWGISDKRWVTRWVHIFRFSFPGCAVNECVVPSHRQLQNCGLTLTRKIWTPAEKQCAVMAAKLTPLTQKTAILGHLATEIYTACLSRSQMRVQKLLGTLS
jgi:hypothetical protein